MKRFFAAAAAAIVAVAATAQSNDFHKGDVAININYGMGAFDKSLDDDSNMFQHSIGATMEYGIIEGIIKGKGTISVGAQVGFGVGSEKRTVHQNGGATFETKLTGNRIRIATRGALHYQFIPQVDTYAGMMFGIVDIDKYKNKFTVDDINKVIFTGNEWSEKKNYDETRFISPALFAGARVMLSDSFGINVETTWDRFAYFAAGITLRL